MIIGIGTDIMEISRFETVQNNSHFMQKYFTQKEIEYFQMRKNRVNTIAGAFCVKEAFSKAVSTGFVGFGPIDIEVLRLDSGKPYVNLYGVAFNIAQELGVKKVHVSISHSSVNAIAFVVVEGDQEGEFS